MSAWKCCGCGAPSLDREETCRCPTRCVWRRVEGKAEYAWKASGDNKSESAVAYRAGQEDMRRRAASAAIGDGQKPSKSETNADERRRASKRILALPILDPPAAQETKP